MKKIAMLVLSAMLAGCVTHYAAPTSGPTAQVTLSARGIDYGAWILVQNFADEACTASPSGTRLAFFGTKDLQGQSDPHEGTTRTMAAGSPAVITFAYQAGAAGFTDTEACTLTQSFVPAPGGRYRVDFEKAGDVCAVRVSRVDGGDPKAVDALHPVDPPCFNMVSG